MKNYIVLALTFVMAGLTAQQNEFVRPITTAVPFLTISPDARASGMGDMGVATTMDNYAQQWNPAKYSFATEKVGFSVSYTPYLQGLVTDIALLNANFYNKLNDRSAFGVGITYFGLGEIQLRQNFDDNGTIVEPNEFSIDGSYSLKLSETFSMAVGGRFINSNLRLPEGTQDSQAASAFAVDIAGYFQSNEVALSSFNGRWRGGFNISNLGGKISYDNGGQENFLPTNLGLGVGFDFIFDQDNILGLHTEFNKLLVPTPQDFNGDGDIDIEDVDEYNDISFFQGVFESFGDAPDGFSEELKEISWSFGVEYRYLEKFMLRAGYFNESEEKGARQFATVGAGFRYKSAKIDLSYLLNTSSVPTPLENTLRFSLSFNFGDEYTNN